MQVIDEDNLVFSGRDGEQITIKFTSHNTGCYVTYTIDDGTAQTVPQDQNLVFSLGKKPNNKPTVVRLFFHFINSGSGGSYDVDVSGQDAGDTFQEPSWMQTGQDPVEGKHIFRVQ